MRNKKLFKSLCAYMLVSVFVWSLVPLLIAFVFPNLNVDQSTFFQLHSVVNGSLSQTTALMPIILYCMRFCIFPEMDNITLNIFIFNVFSKSYRKAFQRGLFDKIRCWKTNRLTNMLCQHMRIKCPNQRAAAESAK